MGTLSLPRTDTAIRIPTRLVFLGTVEDTEYLPYLKSCVTDANCSIIIKEPSTIAEIIAIAKSKQATGIISTSAKFLKMLLNRMSERKDPSLDAYTGSYFTFADINIVFINPLKNLLTVPYAKFVTSRVITKLTHPHQWPVATEFTYDIGTPANMQDIFDTYYLQADHIVIDIETIKEPLRITIVGYTAIFFDDAGKAYTHSLVIDLRDTNTAHVMLAWIRKINSLPQSKILQNGKYDTAYLMAYNAEPIAYLHDTANYMHSWYCELPKDLAFLGAFFVREAMYWKDLANTSDRDTYYLYNAKDTWTTANVFLAQITQMPQWARDNYLKEFPVVAPCVMCEMRGIKRDLDVQTVALAELETEITKQYISLNTMLGKTNFNSNSPKQVKTLLHILGFQHFKSSDEKHLVKAGYMDVLARRILAPILEIRGLVKLRGTYFGKEFSGRVLYSLNPHGTDSGRLASREHHFWTGVNIQNQPRGKAVKQTLVADEDFVLFEVDLEQAESRGTAHVSGDQNLLTAVLGTKDFHSLNASAFFGVLYELIFSDILKKTLDKALRDLAKRVNHGANYVMGPDVLVDTMGQAKIEEARRLLGLNKLWSHRQIAEFLLERFHATYPGLRGTFYPAVVAEICTTHMLRGATGWTRYCFGNPTKSKLIYNSYIAHVPQSLNAMILNKAFVDVFKTIAMHPDHQDNFKLLAQIHDSILFQVRIGHEYLAQQVKQCMEIPIDVKGYDGKVRTMIVPAGIKGGKDGMGAKYWSDTE